MNSPINFEWRALQCEVSTLPSILKILWWRMSEKILFTRRWHRALYWSSPVSPIFCIQVFIESVVTTMWSGWLYTAMIGSEILKLLNHARPQVCSDSVKIDSSATHCDQVWSQCPMLGPELELTNIGSSNTGAQDRSSPSIATSSFFCNQVFFEDDPSSSTSLLSSVGITTRS